MAKYGIKDIAAMLAAKKGMDVADAEKYVEIFFTLVSESLIPDKVVKVKGFGTFKLVEVRDRESVDVNTGERVVIDGHSKISFTPDNTLKELVNKPFSQFETVVLNEGVDFDKLSVEDFSGDIEEESDELTNNPSEKEEEHTEEPEEKTDNSIKTQSLITEALSQAKEELPVTAAVDSSEKEEDSKESLTETEEPVAETECSETELEEQEEPETIIEISPAKEKETPEEVRVAAEAMKPAEPTEPSVPIEPVNNRQKHRKSALAIKVLYTIAAVVLFVLIFFGGVYFGERTHNTAEKKTEPVRVVAKVVKRAKAPTVAEKKQNIPDSTAIKDSLRKAEEARALEQERQEANSEETEGKGSLENARRMVKTGAYTIDGLYKTITVKPGQTIESLSRQYLGEGMECYVQVYNNKLKAIEGEKVNIPKLKLKKKATNKKVS